MTYSLVKIIANANVCYNNKLGYLLSPQSTIKSSLGGSCVLPMDPEHKLKKKLKNSSKKLKTQAKNSKSRHFLKRCLPEMRPKRKPALITPLTVTMHKQEDFTPTDMQLTVVLISNTLIPSIPC